MRWEAIVCYKSFEHKNNVTTPLVPINVSL